MSASGANTTHTLFRVLEAVSLIPAWSMGAALVAAYSAAGMRTPGGILCLFITTLLAWVWAFCILVLWIRAYNTALWIAFWDLVAMGILIAGVATTANMVTEQCSAATQNVVFITSDGREVETQTQAGSGVPVVDGSNVCGLLQGAWALAIANIVFFFITAIVAAVIWRNNRYLVEEVGGGSRGGVGGVPVREKVYHSDSTRRSRSASHSTRSRSQGNGRRHHSRHSSEPRRVRTTKRIYVEDV